MKKHCCSKSNISKRAPGKNSHLSSCLRKGRVWASSSLHYPTESCHFPDSFTLWLSRWSPWHTAPSATGKILPMFNTSLLWTSFRRATASARRQKQDQSQLVSCWMTPRVLPLKLLLFFPLSLLQLFPQLGHRLGQVARDLQTLPRAWNSFLLLH